MALVSPGIEVSIIDESQYLSTAVGTVPLLIVATAENKLVNGLIAPGTTKTNAGKIYGITSQRELAATFGVPVFRRSANDVPLHGDELNEYGLMAAYSALGLGNRAWIVRADIDLDDLVGTQSRPKGLSPNGTNWLDTSNTQYGIFEFDDSVAIPGVPFVSKTPIVIDLVTDTTGSPPVPNTNIGAKGDYAVVVHDDNNYVFFKSSNNSWQHLGSSAWADDIPVVTTTKSNAAVFGSFTMTSSDSITINGTTVSPVSSITSMAGLASLVNTVNAANVIANVNTVTQRLEIRITTGSNSGAGNLTIAGSSTLLANLGLAAGSYSRAAVSYGSFAQQPAWRRTDTVPRPSKSVWIKTSVQGGGINFVYKRYNATTGLWNMQTTKVYANGYEALYGLDSVGGGLNITAGTTFVKYNVNNDGKVSFKLYTQRVSGQTKVTGSVTAPTFVTNETFTIVASVPGSSTPTVSATCTILGTTAAAFVAAIQAAGVPNVTALVETSGAITISHRSGGIITLTNTIGTPITAAGFSPPVYTLVNGISTQTSGVVGVTPNLVTGSINLSNWIPSVYTYSGSEPYTVPADGRLWYYNDPTEVDIMISDTAGWRGYKNVSSDARGYNLTVSDPLGVIVSASRPEYQSDNTALESGDLWLDTSDLENYPRLYRFDKATQTWNLIDNSDRTTQNGIIFADARWSTTANVNPITGTIASIQSLLINDNVDPDVPDYRLYPRGTLLFNTRRSGYTVKKFVYNYFNATAFPSATLPSATSGGNNAWVSQIGYDSVTQYPLLGHKAQRNQIVEAMRAAVDGNLDLREEGYAYSLLAAPGYHELIPNLIALNNDRANTGFVIGDSPIHLRSTINEINTFSNSLTTATPYLGVYYPSALTTDLSGNEIAVPASHMMLRTFLYSDNVSYQWFAPAGTRRGLVDNALALGYVDANSGSFVITGINNNLRDALYETRINPITLINGVGIVAYGQKTRSAVISGASSSLDRINVARLVNYLRTVLSGVGNQFLFEPNDKITRDQIKQLIESLMNDLVAKRGIYDYIVVCDETNNTADRIARNELYVDIAIEPMKAVEFIYIPIRLKNPGTIAGTATAGITTA